jgi:hypothetical protein
MENMKRSNEIGMCEFLCYTTLAIIRIIIGKKVKVSLCLTNYALRHEDVWGSGRIDPRILEAGTTARDERSASRPGTFTPGVNSHWTR